MDELYEDKVRRVFQEHTDSAVTTLVDLAKTSKSDSVRRMAANDIIEHGHQRKGSDPLSGLLDDGKLQIQVNLIQFEASEHGREVNRKKSVEIAVNPPVAIEPPETSSMPQADGARGTEEPEDLIPIDPLLELVLTNPGEAE